MNRVLRLGIAGTAAVALGAAGTVAWGGAADAAKVTVPATFTMYANVDADGDLGSNAGAVNAGILPGSTIYEVTFKKPVGTCAAVVQVGVAGGSSQSTHEVPVAYITGPDTFDITFGTSYDDGSTEQFHEPFMMTVTCRK